ncbi:MAG: regulatory protein RecX [Candidatus Coatesbacteria bacterium]|nr:regulatory protein RecX [Candidatus Coatesbacteria bacterium]
MASAEEQKGRREAWQKALKFLSARAHSAAELRRKLRAHGFLEGDIDSVIEELKARNYLNDLDLSVFFIQGLIERKPYGRRWFLHKLLQRGIEKEIIEEALDKAFADVSELELASRAIQSKLSSLEREDMRSKRVKLARFLSNRGFPEAMVLEITDLNLSDNSDRDDENST